MTVSNTTPLVENKTGNGSWTTIAVTPGQILQNSDGTHAIKVIKTTIADGTAVELVETTDYTVTLDGTSPSTGTITLVGGAPSSAFRYTVLSDLAPKQEVNLQNGTIVDMEDIESALDRLTLYAQKQDEKLERAIVLPEDTLVRNLAIDSLDSQAGKVLKVNATEDGFDYVDVTEGISQATFDINALSEIDSVVTSTDKLPIYDVSTGLTKYVTPDDLGISGVGSNMHGNIQQIVSVTKTDGELITTGGANIMADVTGLSVTITPSRRDSKLLIGGFISVGGNGHTIFARILKDNTPAGIQPDVSGTHLRAHAMTYSGGAAGPTPLPFCILDEANTTNPVTFKVQASTSAGSSLYINRGETDTDSTASIRSVSHLYIMEVLQNPSGNWAANFKYNTYRTNNAISNTFTSPTSVLIPIDCFKLTVEPLSASSYTALIGNTYGTRDTAEAVGWRWQKDGSFLYSATSPGSRSSVTGVETDHGNIGPITTLSLEAISSTSVSDYILSFTSFVASGGTSNFTAMNGANTTTSATTDIKTVSSILGINFITSTGSTWKQAGISTLSSIYNSASVAAGSFQDPSISVTLTPNSASNYLFCMANIIGSKGGTTGTLGLRINRDGTPTLIGTSVGSRSACTAGLFHGGANSDINTAPITFVLPATSASSTTIKVELVHTQSTNAIINVNCSSLDTDASTFKRGISQLSVIEIDPIA